MALTVLIWGAVFVSAVAGVIHQPFFGYVEGEETDGLGRTVWGGPGAGVHGNIQLGAAPPLPPLKACLQRNLRDERQEPCVDALKAEAVCKCNVS